MADSLELILRVHPAPGDDAGKLARWLRGELPGLDVQEADRLPGEAVPVDTKGSADIAGLLLVKLDPKALQFVLAKLAGWMTQSDRMLEISTEGYTLKLGPPARQREKVINGSPVSDTAVSRAQPEGEPEAVTEASPSDVPTGLPALEPGKALVLYRPRESPLPTEPARQGGRELSREGQPADTRLLLKGGFNIDVPPGQEFRRTAAFAGITSLLGSGLAVLLSIAVLAITEHYHGFTVSANYPVHRIYEGIVRYLVRVTPPPASPHILLTYSVYLAVLPVLFAVVFMHLKVGSTRLFVATVACVAFMAAPFIIVVTSIRVGSTNCGSWNYPEPNSGSECYNALTIDFRIAFAVGVVGLIVPIIYLIQGKKKALLLRAIEAFASGVMAPFSFIIYLARRRTRDGRDALKNAEAILHRVLLPHERQTTIVRQHPAVLIGPSVLTLAWAVAAAVLTAFGNELIIIAAWTAWLALLVRMAWKGINWSGTFFVVTSARLLLVSRTLSSNAFMMPLTKVVDMSFHQSFTGRLLGFGRFIIEAAGANQTMQTIDHIPYPQQLYHEICGLIYKDPASGDD